MLDTILGWIVLTAGLGVIAYALLARPLGFHRPMKWQGGGEVSMAGELAGGVFFLCGGLAVQQDTGVWVLPALVAWVVGFVSQQRANRRHAEEEDALRERNAVHYPGVFENPPPEDTELVPGDELDVFDCGACTYLGRASREDLKALFEQFADMPDQGPNDLFLIPESLEMLPEGSLSQEFRTLLQRAFEERNYLVLRWMQTGPSRDALPSLKN